MQAIPIAIEDLIVTSPCLTSSGMEANFFSSDTQNCLLHCQSSVPAANSPLFTGTVLTASAVAGCRGCQFLNKLVDFMLITYPELQFKGLSFRWADTHFTLEVQNNGSKIRRIQFFYPKGAGIRIAGMQPSSLLTGNTSSDISFNRAQRMVENCVVHHEHSCGSGNNMPLPKRLLKVVEIFNSNGNAGIRLETTESRTGRYACLSHCWGDPDLIQSKTTTATIKQYHQFISWNLLPKTFQDAVILTRKLGLDYLWIDSLCIIQNSKSDWEVESAKMGDIYSNSYITIAAAASGGSAGGCFAQSVPDSCVMIREHGHPEVLVAMRDCQGAGKIKNADSTFEKSSPLFTRGWVYQERIMSRRILYCNKSELQLSCAQTLQCECGSSGMAPHFSVLQQTLNVARLKATSLLKPDEKGGGLVGEDYTLLLYRNWLKVVQRYSKLRLTKGSDKLPALSATARCMSKGLNSDYLAGIWRVSLLEGLLWYVVEGPLELRPRGEHWRAPTWSWASVDTLGGVRYVLPNNSFSETFRGKIQAAECTPAGKDAMGQVSSGFICIKTVLGNTFWRTRCRGCSATKRKGGNGSITLHYTLHATHIPVEPVGRWERCHFSQPALNLLGGDVHFWADALLEDVDKLDFLGPLDKGTCQVAPCHLLYVHRLENVKERNISDMFLVLVAVKSKQDTYKRVGLASIVHTTKVSRDTWWRIFWPLISSQEQTVWLV